MHTTNRDYYAPRRRRAKFAHWFGWTISTLLAGSVIAFLALVAFAVWGLK